MEKKDGLTVESSNNSIYAQSYKRYLEYYRRLGLVVLPLLPRSKQCFVKNWQQLNPDELLQHFNSNSDSNIGIRLDGLVCIDVERPELWPVLTELSIEAMSRKTWIQRTGKGYHILFRGQAKPLKVDGFAEIRSGNSQYIVVAPSIHPDTGKPYQWVSDIRSTPIAELDGESLDNLKHKLEVLRRFKKFIEAMSDCWQKYHRHNLALWLSGALYKMGLSFNDAEIILKAIIYLANDEEKEDRLRALKDTFEKDDSRVKAWSGLKEELREMVGEEAENVIKLLRIGEGLSFEATPLAQLIEDAKEIDYLCYPIIPRRCLVVLGGKGGVGKSLTGLHIAYHVSSGKPIFGYYDVKNPTKVLIIDNENNPTILKQRVEIMKLNPLENIDVINFTNWRLDKKGAIAKLKQLIQTNSYGLIIMDNWTTLVSSIDENDAVRVSNVLTKLRKLAYETDSTILLIHHQRKGLAYAVNESDELRGSSVLFNEPDVVYLLEQDKIIPEDRILKTIKNRLGEPISIRLSFEADEEEGLKIVFKGEEEIDTQVIKASKVVLEHLKKVGEDSRKNVVDLFSTNFSRSVIDRALKYLVERSLIIKRARGVYAYIRTLDDAFEVES
jgi:archaellum biogenesis ATPase FlaH